MTATAAEIRRLLFVQFVHLTFVFGYANIETSGETANKKEELYYG